MSSYLTVYFRIFRYTERASGPKATRTRRRYAEALRHDRYRRVPVSDYILEGVSARAKDNRWRAMDANANQIVSSTLCHGRNGPEKPFRQTRAPYRGDEVGARSRYIGSLRCPAMCTAAVRLRAVAVPRVNFGRVMLPYA